MRKYFKAFQTAIVYSSVYRIEMFLSLAQSVITPAFMLLALSSARSNSVSWNQLIPYYVLVALTFPIFRSQIDEDIGELAASGDVANFIVKPISPYLFFLSQETGKKFVSLLTLLPLLLLAILAFHYAIPSLIPIAFSLLVGFLINYNLSYLIGLGSFWLDEFWVLSNLRHVITTLLGGLILPYSFFPEKFVSILKQELRRCKIIHNIEIFGKTRIQSCFQFNLVNSHPGFFGNIL